MSDLRQLLDELNELIAQESSVLDQAKHLPSFETIHRVYEHEERIDRLLIEIAAIGRYSKRDN